MGESLGLFIGYYEYYLCGVNEWSEEYVIFLLCWLDDLVMINLGLFCLDLRGENLVGCFVDGRLVFYVIWVEIGVDFDVDNVLLWVVNLVDVFFF